ncbi:MAG: hypothetical protein LBV60_21195, partial [Streptomyces sp.]|nr:hypothetical protein [Streptomyces sp.]
MSQKALCLYDELGRLPRDGQRRPHLASPHSTWPWDPDEGALVGRGGPSNGGESVEQVAKACRRLNVGQVALTGEFVDSGVSDVLPHVCERRSVGGCSAVALA